MKIQSISGVNESEYTCVEGTRVSNMSGIILSQVNTRLAASSGFKRTNVQEPGLCAVASSSPDFIICIFYHRKRASVEILAFVLPPLILVIVSQHLAPQTDKKNYLASLSQRFTGGKKLSVLPVVGSPLITCKFY